MVQHVSKVRRNGSSSRHPQFPKLCLPCGPQTHFASPRGASEVQFAYFCLKLEFSARFDPKLKTQSLNFEFSPRFDQKFKTQSLKFEFLNYRGFDPNIKTQSWNFEFSPRFDPKFKTQSLKFEFLNFRGTEWSRGSSSPRLLASY